MTATSPRPVFLLGMPRSGTTWLSQIVESSPLSAVRLSPNYSYAFKDELTGDATAEQWRRQLDRALHSDDPFVTQNWRRDTGELGRFPKRDPDHAQVLAIKDTRFHELYDRALQLLPQSRVVYLVRNPAAALWSWRNCKEFPEGADFAAEWRSGSVRKREGQGEYWGFADWVALTSHYLALAEREPQRVMVLRYEDLVRDPEQSVAGLFAFLGLPVGAETLDFLAESRSRHDSRPYAVYKSPAVADAWRADFPADILATIEAELSGTALAGFLS